MSDRVDELLHELPGLQALLGCAWGRTVSTDDDSDPCLARAVQIVCVHDGLVTHEWKLCARHRDRVYAESTPRHDT